MKKTKKLHDLITSIDVISVSILLYMLGYSIKMAAFLNNILTDAVKEASPRLISSVLIAIVASQMLMAVSLSTQQKYLPPILAFIDAILLMFVLDAFNADLIILERIKKVFIALFLSFMFYQLIEVFKLKKEQYKAQQQQQQAQLEQKRAENELKTAYDCTYCGKHHENQKQLSGHLANCLFYKIHKQKIQESLVVKEPNEVEKVLLKKEEKKD